MKKLNIAMHNREEKALKNENEARAEPAQDEGIKKSFELK